MRPHRFRLFAVISTLTFAPALFAQTTFNFNANNGGFTVISSGPTESIWTYGATAGVGGNGAWYVNGTGSQGIPSNSSLLSPVLTVSTTGSATLTFNHRYSFEDNSTPYDGGQVQVSVNGGAFTAIPNSSFTTGGYNGTIIGHGVLDNQPGFNGTSSGYANPSYITSSATLGSYFGGDTIRLKFLGAWDEYLVGPSPNWVIDDVTLTNAVPEPSFYAGVLGLLVLASAVTRRRRGRPSPTTV